MKRHFTDHLMSPAVAQINTIGSFGNPEKSIITYLSRFLQPTTMRNTYKTDTPHKFSPMQFLQEQYRRST